VGKRLHRNGQAAGSAPILRRSSDGHEVAAGQVVGQTDPLRQVSLKLVIPEEIPDALCNAQAANVETDLSRKSSEYLPGIFVVILGFTWGRE
jgi:hypothetical protein